MSKDSKFILIIVNNFQWLNQWCPDYCEKLSVVESMVSPLDITENMVPNF